MQKNNRVILIATIIYVGIIIILAQIFKYNKFRISELKDIDKYNKQEDSITYNIENYSCVKKKDKYEIEINGWCLKERQKVKEEEIYVVLHKINTERYYKLPTEVYIREDVTGFFSDGYNYDYSGLYVNIKTDKFDFDMDEYDIYILYSLNKNEYLIKTDLFLTAEKNNE